jgi:hypothetical protein
MGFTDQARYTPLPFGTCELASRRNGSHRTVWAFRYDASWPDPKQLPLEPSYVVTQKFSNNLALFRRAEWLQVNDQALGQESGSNLAALPQFSGNDLRYLNEHVIECYLEKTGKKNLMKLESLDWSVSHVNVWGEALRKVRISYIERKGVKRFLNSGRPRQLP